MPSFGHKGHTTAKGNLMDPAGNVYANNAINRAFTSLLYGEVPSGAKKAWVDVKDTVHNGLDLLSGKSTSSVNGSGGGGSSAAGGGLSGFAVKNGQVQFANPDMQKAMQMIQQTAAANNAWSAEQAQKQMDFQKMMSDTAHQREVADLEAAGLNPVLSAGGNGAQVTSGAMAQVDDSNTRLIGELAMAAIDAVSNTALGVSAATSKNGGLMSNYYVRQALSSGAKVAGAVVARKAVGALLSAI